MTNRALTASSSSSVSPSLRLPQYLIFLLVLVGIFGLFNGVDGQLSSNQLVAYTNAGKEVGLLDVETGLIDCSQPVTFPSPPSAGCEWKYGTGTKGQDSAVFPLNGTYFFAAQQVCTNGTVGMPLLFQGYGPFTSCKTELNLLASLAPGSSIDTLNMAWDHTCNVVVLIPSRNIIETKQISEYDGAIRPRPNYAAAPDNCWSKVSGLGALDFGTGSPAWPPGEEQYCGDECIMYTLEQCIIDKKPVFPRNIVGKYYRTGEPVYRISDSFQLQTLSWVPFSGTQQFLGIGQCCTDVWCHPSCQDLDNQLVLVKFLPETQQVSLLSPIGTVDGLTTKLGVEFSGMYDGSSSYAFVYHLGSVLTYTLTLNSENEILSARLTAKVPVKEELHLWFGHR